MNIIKFKDVIKVNDDNFNKYLKGKYAYWVRMQVAVPFDFMSEGEYVNAERSGHLPKGLKECEHYWYTDRGQVCALIDDVETDNINNIGRYQTLNGMSAGETLTIEQLKKFRTWVAKSLLEFNKFDDDEYEVIDYYSKGMYNLVVKSLSKIETNVALPELGPKGSCTVCSNNSVPTLGNVTVCDPLQSYRDYIYRKMVETFSEIEFWADQYKPFIEEMKNYVDGIISVGFVIDSNERYDKFADCSCSDKNSDYFVEILKRLSQALEYVLDNDLQGHRLFISKAFNEFASFCYEKMEW